MIFRTQYFPRQLFARFLRQQILGVVPAILCSVFFTRLYVHSQLSGTSDLPTAFRAFDRAFLVVALVTAGIVVAISLRTAYKLVLPLGRILVRARSIVKKDFILARQELEANVEDLESENIGEWTDLENALRHIRRNMQSQEETISDERSELEAITSALADAVLALGAHGQVLFYNSKFALQFATKSQNAALANATLTDFFRSPEVLDAYKQVLVSGNAHSINVKLPVQNESQPRHFALSLAPFRSSRAANFGAVGVFHDITEMKRLDQVRVDFVANVSHELRSPLTSIKGYAQALSQDLAKDANSQVFLNTIIRNTDRLIFLVEDLLNLSSLESGAAFSFSQVKIAEMNAKLEAQLQEKLSQKQQTLTLQSEVAEIYADEKRLDQVLYNLVDNASKYSPANSQIKVTWAKEPSGVLLHVSDNGPGIPEEFRGRIFERFFRVDQARSRDQGGTGLGLAIVKHILQRHGGSVELKTAELGGADFLCHFPQK